ncbi:UDP-N-acetylmuramate dehydrogenase [Candidatus Margulisiibacteriota bacterium]
MLVFEDLGEISLFQRSNHKPFFVLGNGSKLLINPQTKIKTFVKISPDIFPYSIKNRAITISAGTTCSDLLEIMQKYSLSGLEFIAGIPASLGGMLTMNFGCWGNSISQYVSNVLVVQNNGKQKWLNVDECCFGYRKSIFQQEKWIIAGAKINLSPSNTENIKNNISSFVSKRLVNQPLKAKTIGCLFKNPADIPAGQVLEELGFKGYTYKNLKISEKHANFLVNLGNTEFEDILTFISLIQEKAYKTKGIKLELEAQVIK